jgi:peptide/nickel transport system substrate-binding protein
MPAHRTPAEWRISPIGTGPFVLKEYKRDQHLLLERNSAYWVPGRPYLDGARFSVIPNQSSRIASFKSLQLDVDNPTDTPKPVMDAIAAVAPDVKFIPVTMMGFPALHFNAKKPPFDNPELRRAVSLAIDRVAFIKGMFQGGMVRGGVNLPPPAGVWGLGPEQIADIPGYGDPAQDRNEAKGIMRALGYGPEKPLTTVITTRHFRNYADIAAWMAGDLKEIWIKAEVRLIETGVYYGVVARRDFALVINPTGVGVDDPDVNFYENYSCNSQRNYADYCVPEVQALVDAQSQTLDPAKRLLLVHEIDRRLLKDASRVIPGWYIFYHARQPYVRNYLPHQSNYNFGRLQEVWLDK